MTFIFFRGVGQPPTSLNTIPQLVDDDDSQYITTSLGFTKMPRKNHIIRSPGGRRLVDSESFPARSSTMRSSKTASPILPVLRGAQWKTGDPQDIQQKYGTHIGNSHPNMGKTKKNAKKMGEAPQSRDISSFSLVELCCPSSYLLTPFDPARLSSTFSSFGWWPISWQRAKRFPPQGPARGHDWIVYFRDKTATLWLFNIAMV